MACFVNELAEKLENLLSQSVTGSLRGGSGSKPNPGQKKTSGQGTGQSRAIYRPQAQLPFRYLSTSSVLFALVNLFTALLEVSNYYVSRTTNFLSRERKSATLTTHNLG